MIRRIIGLLWPWKQLAERDGLMASLACAAEDYRECVLEKGTLLDQLERHRHEIEVLRDTNAALQAKLLRATPLPDRWYPAAGDIGAMPKHVEGSR